MTCDKLKIKGAKLRVKIMGRNCMTLSWDCIKPCLGFFDRDNDGDVDLEDLRIIKNEITELAYNTKLAIKETAQLIESSKKLVKNNAEATAQIDTALDYLNLFDKRIDNVQKFADSAEQISTKLPIKRIRIKFQEAEAANSKIRPDKKNKNNKSDTPEISFAELKKLAKTLEEIEQLMGLDDQPAPTRTNSAPWHI